VGITVHQTPSDKLFVVKVAPQKQEAAARRLAAVGRVEPLAESLLLLRAAASSGDAKTIWNRARQVLGSAGTIQPVLLDEGGVPHYPTGEISVRFQEPPPDKLVQDLAAAHGLRLRDRNEFVPEQVVFQPLDAARSYIPELVRELADAGSGLTVWANTLSHFRRG
jgi:hypothetical protein